MDSKQYKPSFSTGVWLSGSMSPERCADDPFLCAVPQCMGYLQVRWIGFRDCWVTAADNDLLRLWSTAGKKVEELAYKGGPCR
jgi:hypothetical protein